MTNIKQFSEIKIGEIFEYENKKFLKTTDTLTSGFVQGIPKFDITVNAVCKKGKMYSFKDTDEVIYADQRLGLWGA